MRAIWTAVIDASCADSPPRERRVTRLPVCLAVIDHREHAATFEVHDANHLQHGLLFLPTQWSVALDGAETKVSRD